MKIDCRPRSLVFSCAVMVMIYVILFEVIARTGMIEKVMASTYSVWELVLIAAFLALRVFVYLAVPPMLIAIGVYVVAKRVVRA